MPGDDCLDRAITHFLSWEFCAGDPEKVEDSGVRMMCFGTRREVLRLRPHQCTAVQHRNGRVASGSYSWWGSRASHPTTFSREIDCFVERGNGFRGSRGTVHEILDMKGNPTLLLCHDTRSRQRQWGLGCPTTRHP